MQDSRSEQSEGNSEAMDSSDADRKDIDLRLQANRDQYQAHIAEAASDDAYKQLLLELKQATDVVIEIIERLKAQAGNENVHDVSSLDSIKWHIEKYLLPHLLDYGDERQKLFHVSYSEAGAMGNDGDLYMEFSAMNDYAENLIELDSDALIDAIKSCQEIYERVRAIKLKYDRKIGRNLDEHSRLTSEQVRAERESDEALGEDTVGHGRGVETVDSRNGKVVHPHTAEWDWLARRNLLAFRPKGEAA